MAQLVQRLLRRQAVVTLALAAAARRGLTAGVLRISSRADVENPRPAPSPVRTWPPWPRRNGRRTLMERQAIDAELATAGAQELLTSAQPARLAYLGKDGTPRVIPVGFFWTGDQFVIASATTSPKVTALSARPDVALVIDAGNTPDQARALSIRGRASVEIVDGVVQEYLAAARKTMDAEAAAEFEQNCREVYDQQARIAITPHWVRYYDFGAGRVPQFLQDLVERNRP
jgi:nitroimidazol reductase NimA-like FMN-containing flavoprotein (pyridoxamine 5'-phosphate oxidase superfamily)